MTDTLTAAELDAIREKMRLALCWPDDGAYDCGEMMGHVDALIALARDGLRWQQSARLVKVPIPYEDGVVYVWHTPATEDEIKAALDAAHGDGGTAE